MFPGRSLQTAVLAASLGACSNDKDPDLFESTGPAGSTEAEASEAGAEAEEGPLLDFGGGSDTNADDGGTGTGTPCEQAAAAQSNQGCEFWAVDLPNAWQIALQVGAEDQQFGIVVANASSMTANIAIYAGNSTTPLQSGPVPTGGVRVFQFDNSLGIETNGNTVGTAYRVESDFPVTVYQYNPLDNTTPVYSNDASLLFPSHTLDRDYTAITGDALWLTTANGGAFVTAVATEDDTYVTFYPTPGVTMYPGNNVAVLQRGETFTMISNDLPGILTPPAGAGNLSGTRVESNHPVAVFSGNLCSWEPTPMEDCCCDHLEHQMLPLAAWGDGYVVTPAAPASGVEDDDVRVRIVGSFDGTQLSYNPSAPPGAPTTINAYQTVVFTTSSPFIVTGDKPFAAAQFLMSNEAVTPDPTPDNPDDNFFTGDPAMILLPPVAQFQGEYVFQVPLAYETNWITVVRPAGAQVILDGTDRTSDPAWTAIATANGVDWQYAHFILDVGAHHIESDAPQGIGIVVAGYDVAVSYGFAGGSGVEYIDAPPPPPIP